MLVVGVAYSAGGQAGKICGESICGHDGRARGGSEDEKGLHCCRGGGDRRA